MISISILVGIIVLWVIGGQKKGSIRDVGCTILLGLGIALTVSGDIKDRVIAGIATIALANIIRIGYGNYSPEDDDKPSFLASITKDRKGYIIRLIWGALVGIVTPIALVVMGLLMLPSYIAYIATNVLVNFSISRLEFAVFWADLCASIAFGSLLFYILWR